jgi:HEAT repeat protein
VKCNANLVSELKLILEQMVATRRQYPRRSLAQKARQVRQLRVENWLDALDRAIGRSVQRKRAAADLLAELTDLPEVQDRFAAWLKDADLAWRAEMIAFIGEKGLYQFAPLLNDILAGDGDELCLAYAITSAGELRSEVNLTAVLKLATDDTGRMLWNRLLWTLTDYNHPLCRPALERVYRAGPPKGDQVIAAWGLGKLGDEEAIQYLADMLDDPDTPTPTCSNPGESLRAAQALCDIYGWPFQWNTSWVDKTRRRWQRLERERSKGQ